MGRQMKASGIEWLPEIPDNWQAKKNKELFYEVNDRCERGDNYTLLSVSEYYGIAPKSEKVEKGQFETRAETLDGYKICRIGDIVMNIMLAWKSSTACSEYDGIISPAYCVYRQKMEINTKYYHYLFRTNLCADLFKRYSTGIIDSRLRLYPDKFLALYSPVPPLLEQNRIVTYLDGKCLYIDAVIEKTKASIEEYKKLKQAVITQVVTRGIRGDRPMKESGIEWIGKIPDDWSVIRKLSYLCDSEISYGIVKLLEPDDVNGVKVLRCSDVFPGYISLENVRTVTREVSDEYQRTILNGGEIVIAVRGSLGGCSVVPDSLKGYNVAREVAVISLKKDNLNRFVMYYLLSDVFNYYRDSHLLGSVYIGLNIELLSACPVVLPSYEEQCEIADYLDIECSKIGELILKKEKFIADLLTYKKSLIYEYVTGKKEVPSA